MTDETGATSTTPAMLWRRLDTPGHDACRLRTNDAGWVIEGTTVFLAEGVPVRFTYEVVCDLAWHSRYGRVEGWIGERPVDHRVARTPDGEWTLDGTIVPGLAELIDLDLGITPATNLLPIRRLALGAGQAADAPAAWLDPMTGELSFLRQRYERRTDTAYWYESPSFNYAELLDVAPTGFILRYPGLWEAESSVVPSAIPGRTE